MPVQLWNLGSTVYSATDPSGPGSDTRRSPSVLSGPQPKQWPSHSTFMGRTIAEVAKSTSPPTSPHGGEGYVAELTAPPTSPRGGEGYVAELTAPPNLPTRGGGTSRTTWPPPSVGRGLLTLSRKSGFALPRAAQVLRAALAGCGVGVER